MTTRTDSWPAGTPCWVDLMAPDLGPLGRMGLALDPAGALFGVRQAGSFPGSQRVGEPGGLAWDDLRSTDPAAAQVFYSAVFGFEVTPLDMAGPDYGTFAAPGDPAPYGGIGGLMGGDGPSRWLVYFTVPSTDDAERAAVAGGGACRRRPSTRRSGAWPGWSTRPGRSSGSSGTPAARRPSARGDGDPGTLSP